ncbi:MAG: LLM class F420-dependent oxidoreductase [Dehalococcoidia bacterium]
MSQQQVHFGIQTPPQHVTYDELVKLWRAAEQLGYDSAWVFDHFMPLTENYQGPCLEGMVALTALATQTSRLRLGALVLGNSYRHPALLANMAATQDIISNGRLEMGIGAGWHQREYDAYGIPFPPPAVRIRQLAEAIQVLKLLWTEHKANFSGKYYTLTEALCEPKPIQKPRPPIWVGGAGPQLTLRVVAQHADGWNTFASGIEEYQALLKALADHCAALDRDPATVQKSLHITLVIGRTSDEAEAKLQRIPLGRRDRTLEDARRRLVAGTPEECIARLKQYASLGVNHFIIGMMAPYDYAGLELFAQKVIPAFR